MYQSSRLSSNRLASLNWLASKRPLFSTSRNSLCFPKSPGSYQQQTAISTAQWTSVPRSFPSSGFKLLNSSLLLAKLGYGVTSTVWFGCDLVNFSYVALKVYMTGEKRDDELKIYYYLIQFVQKLFNHFIITDPHGQHICLIHKSLKISASELLEWIPGKTVTLKNIKVCIRQLLVVLNFLHSITGVVHTNNNLLLPTPKPETLSNFKKEKIKTPSARKVLQDHTIYISSHFPPGNRLPLLTNFSEARLNNKKHNKDIIPNPYRAPEDYKVDIWNITIIISRNPDGIFDDHIHFAELVALLGCPPPSFSPIPDITFESLTANIRKEDKDGFLR
ncbi:hypothetical protein BO94DRAFT_562250 [Aspergillus sclerotioniger CBS 115572]|uniref:Protein kinase domain-containing protein n=1 Tax=Aspergillus sclerotioniger CBS 115572 TaxID=1450535 RepID=A0A317XCX4_9EURO|nr:hypothetical protein BO94DRAFT_562250 [Aspergillus sclerotioniger CBS 115572]PWY95562.1 hypothetical protein BO94DRAFT_562250 [Aspergillus sclerotioniger CBS 115572]